MSPTGCARFFGDKALSGITTNDRTDYVRQSGAVMSACTAVHHVIGYAAVFAQKLILSAYCSGFSSQQLSIGGDVSSIAAVLTTIDYQYITGVT